MPAIASACSRCRRWRSRDLSSAPDLESRIGRAHDLRRTVLTQMAALGVEPVVLGHVANHRTTTRAGITLAIYVKHSYDAEKRRALKLWADRLAAIVETGAAPVVPMRKRAAQ